MRVGGVASATGILAAVCFIAAFFGWNAVHIETARNIAGETVVVVTHGGVLDIAHRLATGKPLEAMRDFAIPNAALNWIEHTAGSWRLLAWADESHLADALDELPGT